MKATLPVNRCAIGASGMGASRTASRVAGCVICLDPPGWSPVRSRVAPAIDAEHLAGDVPGLLGGDEGAGGGDVFWCAHAPDRGGGDDVVDAVIAEVAPPFGVAQHRSVDET